VNKAGHEPGAGNEVHLPHPSVWPVVLAAGVSLLLFGIVTSLAFSAVGVVTIVGGLAGWIQELRHE
jgi:hypothetical protein